MYICLTVNEQQQKTSQKKSKHIFSKNKKQKNEIKIKNLKQIKMMKKKHHTCFQTFV